MGLIICSSAQSFVACVNNSSSLFFNYQVVFYRMNTETCFQFWSYCKIKLLRTYLCKSLCMDIFPVHLGKHMSGLDCLDHVRDVLTY